MSGLAIVIIVAAMGCSWLFRELLLRMLRTRHPDAYADLGQPSTQRLASISPRHADLQIRFWTYLWGGKVFRIRDWRVSGLAALAIASDIGLAAGLVLFFASAR